MAFARKSYMSHIAVDSYFPNLFFIFILFAKSFIFNAKVNALSEVGEGVRGFLFPLPKITARKSWRESVFQKTNGDISNLKSKR